MNIELSELDSILDRTLATATSVDPQVASQLKIDIISALRESAESKLAEEEVADDGSAEAESEEAAEPKRKWQHVIVVSDMTGQIKTELTGWVVQIPEDVSIHNTKGNLHKAMYDFNASKRGRLLPVKTIGDGIESVSGKFFKNADIKIKTKTPVFVVVTDNVLPKE